EAYNNLGLVFQGQGRLPEARSCFEEALSIKPEYAEAYNNLGLVFQGQGRLPEARSCFEEALSIKPEYAEAYYNMGIAFKNQARLAEAISCFEKALSIKSDYAEAHNNMGNALKKLGKLPEAISCYKEVLSIKPGYAEVHNNMGNAFKVQGNLNEATACYRKAVELKPEFAEAHGNLGSALKEMGNPEEAVSCYKKALALKPDSPDAISQLVHQLQLTCSWRELQSLALKLDALTKKDIDKGKRTTESPFMNITRHADPPLNHAVARSWACDVAQRMSNLKIHFSFDSRRSNKTKIVVGYLSNDFRNHPVMHQMLRLYGLHNRDDFEINCYSYGKDDNSQYRARIQEDCDKFVDLSALNHADAATCVYKDQVDILVDLVGQTKDNRLHICGLRPAPVQVSYLGFLGTTGATFLDYVITDRIVTPEDDAPYYSEKFVYLPHCYQINDNTQPISDKYWEKADFGLHEAGFVFCSFNNSYKIEPAMFDIWMKILRQVDKSILWLAWENETIEKNLRYEAKERGVEPERLIFSKKVSIDEHLGRLKLADLALDTRIYNGGATTSNALWAGVPVITLQGSHFVSRMTSSSLAAIGLPELITGSLEEYEALAVRYAHNPDELQAIRERLATNRLTEPFFDTPRFVRNLEKAYKEMWRNFLAGEGPRQIEVVED
ncbi:MAG: O-linked N-acetylglucosamine transferase, SPINDLY family protein, partial [Planctomycetota bacterium]